MRATTKNEGPAGGAARPSGDAQAVGFHSDTQRRAFLRCKLEKSGFTIRVMSDGAWMISRWGHIRELSGMPAIERFARGVGVTC
jgi:hypothetical protein